MYGLPLLLAANAIDYIPFVKLKVASDALLFKLRERNDIEDHPVTLPIPFEYIASPKDALLDQVKSSYKKRKSSHTLTTYLC